MDYLYVPNNGSEIQYENADLDSAVSLAAQSIQWNSDQVCMENPRIYAQVTATDRFIQF